MILPVDPSLKRRISRSAPSKSALVDVDEAVCSQVLAVCA
jgi:hypothetical protein